MPLLSESRFPAISPDGRWVAAYRRRPGPGLWEIVIVPATGGDPVSLGDLPINPSFPLRWTSDGRSVSFTCQQRGIVSNICIVPREGGPARQITSFTDAQIGSHDWSPAGRLLVVRNRTASDLIMITLRDKQ